MNSLSITTSSTFKIIGYIVVMLCATYAFRFSSKYIKTSVSSTARAMSVVKRINVKDFAKVVQNADVRDLYQIIDVRESDELQAVSIPQLKDSQAFVHLPLSTSEVWADQVVNGELLNRDKPTLVMCHHGMRSMRVASFLVAEGFQDVSNVEGGIHSYAMQVDPSIGTY